MKPTNKEIAAAWDRLKDSGHEGDHLVPIKATAAKNPRDVVSLRLGREELREIERAAASANANVSEFIRTAALDKARILAGTSDEASSPAVKLLEARLRRAMKLLTELQGELNGTAAVGPKPRRARSVRKSA